ncbi:hypothetical protein [Pseudoalteromonas luteoviolacea]|uniref:hypothetical protein n=1 Tax=Pseudoalteromonas luteoviolacea TaxID=43657 RepID=UPI001B358223|nr:hypothetical protein [Pseudoalteromonas luteoviolacea]MBQ4836067.1 hypothetical protein [Pseudoalteromonas luteoviolacea]
MNSIVFESALRNKSFISYFKKTGGGFEPLVCEHITLEECITSWLMSDDEYMSSNHYFVPLEGEQQQQRVIPKNIVATCLKSRNIGIAKMWRFYIGFALQMPPMSGVVSKLYEDLGSLDIQWTMSCEQIQQYQNKRTNDELSFY